MPRDERRRQKALARKAERRREKKTTTHPAIRKGHPSLRVAAQWPLHDCLISRSWREPGELVQILVTRSAGGEIAAAGFLVDLGCLGVKDALTHVLTRSDYEAFRASFTGRQPMMRADLNLVAKVIEESIAYAQRLGFSPHPDYRDAAVLLAGADPANCRTSIPLGYKGKPFFIPGPYDTPSKVIRQLERAVGPGNFHYVLALDDVLSTAEIGAEGEDLEERPRSLFSRLFRRPRPS